MTTPDGHTDIDAITKRVQELSEQVAAKAKENGIAWLESYEQILKNMLELEENAAKGTGVDWASNLATSHANFVRETSKAVFDAMRTHLRA
jgi:hypothetical protein